MANTMPQAIDHVLISQACLRRRVEGLGRSISRDYAGESLVLVVALKGAVVFCADLMRVIERPVCLEFVRAASYGAGTTSCGKVRLEDTECGNLTGRHVLVVEDIVDTGQTLAAMLQVLRAQEPASLRTCCLLDKPSRREAPVRADYVGFEIPDAFVVGYGLDYAEQYRHLPYIGVLDASAVE